ncbi:DUF1275 domain-containing protein [Ahniella affigens]|uniref:DUF1275 domain-containing protein n=1 Tax=Ahniella affigens TaxID=2021234 RepID=A0A2P1PQQ4_9GAMM|nr:YoaK family protein [Ahniella affigens]AVP97162.1 DUF1275 domain-containing protein [Ahniella affigens]
MIRLLPRWVWIGAWLLALNAGMVNGIGLFSAYQQSITHLTGTTTLVAGSLATGQWRLALHHALILFAFFAGTVLSGILIQDSTLRLGRRYSVALGWAAGLLLLAIPLLDGHEEAGLYLIACACGLQNAMVSTYSGAVIRTTHLTGMITDLGIYLGHAARGLPIDRRRLRLCLLVISGFVVGVFVGVWALRRLGFDALAIPALICLAAAVGYWVLHVWTRRKRQAGSSNGAP